MPPAYHDPSRQASCRTARGGDVRRRQDGVCVLGRQAPAGLTGADSEVPPVFQAEQETPARRYTQRLEFTRWLSWFVGAALVVAVSVVTLKFSEAEQLAELAEHAEPWWLLLAFVLQAGTYGAQGKIWRMVSGSRAIRCVVRRPSG